MTIGGSLPTASTPGGRLAETLLRTIRSELFDVDEVIRLCLIAFYTDGHVLLEANPGLGKTQLVKALGAALGLTWGRIQFTPDLMPADITGTFMPDPNAAAGRLAFQPGPVFAAVLLADEINRATPKTQSAMLEAMAERQVTVLGRTYLLPDPLQERSDPTPRPFVVLATQNPIDQEGTYTLPEAQADRFMFKLLMPLPSALTLERIVEKEAGPADGARSNSAGRAGRDGREGGRRASLTHEDSLGWYTRVQQEIRQLDALEQLNVHIVNLIAATNGQWDQLRGVEGEDRRWLEEQAPALFPYGLGPRAAIALMRGAKAWTYLFSSDTPRADGAALARVVIPTLRHRLRMTYDWKERFLGTGGAGGTGGGRDAEAWSAPGAEAALLERVIAEVCQRTAPASRASGGPEYARSVVVALREVVERRAC